LNIDVTETEIQETNVNNSDTVMTVDFVA